MVPQISMTQKSGGLSIRMETRVQHQKYCSEGGWRFASKSIPKWGTDELFSLHKARDRKKEVLKEKGRGQRATLLSQNQWGWPSTWPRLGYWTLCSSPNSILRMWTTGVWPSGTYYWGKNSKTSYFLSHSKQTEIPKTLWMDITRNERGKYLTYYLAHFYNFPYFFSDFYNIFLNYKIVDSHCKSFKENAGNRKTRMIQNPIT